MSQQAPVYGSLHVSPPRVYPDRSVCPSPLKPMQCIREEKENVENETIPSLRRSESPRPLNSILQPLRRCLFELPDERDQSEYVSLDEAFDAWLAQDDPASEECHCHRLLCHKKHNRLHQMSLEEN